MAQHDDVGLQRLEIERGILERFAFGQAGSRGGDVDDVRAQANGSELKRGARACARFDEKVDQRFAAQRRDFLDLAGADLLKSLSGIENENDFFRRQFADAK